MSRLPFGKYKDKHIDQVPLGYLEWLLKWNGLYADLREDIQREIAHRIGPPPEEGSIMDLITAGYRAIALKYHPDKGGSIVAMQRLNATARLLRERHKL